MECPECKGQKVTPHAHGVRGCLFCQGTGEVQDDRLYRHRDPDASFWTDDEKTEEKEFAKAVAALRRLYHLREVRAHLLQQLREVENETNRLVDEASISEQFRVYHD